MDEKIYIVLLRLNYQSCMNESIIKDKMIVQICGIFNDKEYCLNAVRNLAKELNSSVYYVTVQEHEINNIALKDYAPIKELVYDYDTESLKEWEE